MSNCAITSIGQTPSTYTRSGAWGTSGVTAATSITEVSGKIGIVTIGMSSQNSISDALVNNYHADSDRRPTTTMVNGGISGKVARFWSDPNDDCWTTLASRITSAGLTTAQCQIFWVLMTNSYPDTYGAMTEAQMLAIFDNIADKYANAHVGYMSSHPYTGYSEDDRAPEPGVYNDSILLASMVGHSSLPFWVDFYDIWADGTTANARTAKVGTTDAANTPISYDCADFSADGVHPASSGRAKIRAAMLERWRVDPVMVGKLWVGEGDPPPDPPAPTKRGIFI